MCSGRTSCKRKIFRSLLVVSSALKTSVRGKKYHIINVSIPLKEYHVNYVRLKQTLKMSQKR